MLFEWDEVKAKSNSRKHRVSFEEAMTVFLDDLSITVSGPEHSSAESRFRIVGESRMNRVLVVSFTERGQRLRLFSARKATHSEIKAYEEKSFS
jgi:uncharacterized DUF497 family protein